MPEFADKERFEETRFLRTTEARKAIWVEIDGDEYCIPDSQIDDDSELHLDSTPGEFGDLVVSAWIAEKKGLL